MIRRGLSNNIWRRHNNICHSDNTRNFTERKESFQSPSVFCQNRVTEDEKVASISTKIDVLQLFVEASSSSPIVIVLLSCALKKIILIPFQLNDPEKNYFNARCRTVQYIRRIIMVKMVVFEEKCILMVTFPLST